MSESRPGRPAEGQPADAPSDVPPPDVPPPDVPPPDVVVGAKEVFGSAAEHLAAIVYDSLVDSDAEPEAHQLRFEHPDMTVELDVSARPEGTEISGRVSHVAAKVALYTRGTGLAMVTPISDLRFGFHPVPHGLVRLSIEGSEPREAIWTDWFRI